MIESPTPPAQFSDDMLKRIAAINENMLGPVRGKQFGLVTRMAFRRVFAPVATTITITPSASNADAFTFTVLGEYGERKFGAVTEIPDTYRHLVDITEEGASLK